MDGHVKALGIIYIVMSGLLLFSLLACWVVFALIGGLVALEGGPEAGLVMMLIVVVSSCSLIFLLPGLLAGFGLLGYRQWARVLTIILSILNLFNFPIGTAVGIYGLWVLFNDETDRLFAEGGPRRYPVH